jgi:putative transposase
MDNGPEYFSGKLPPGNASHRLSGKLMESASGRGISIRHIQPGKPQQNAYIERYNRTVRQEWLDPHIIETIEPLDDCKQSPAGQRDAQDFATQWPWACNNDRPNIPFMV